MFLPTEMGGLKWEDATAPALMVPYVDVNQKVTLQPRWEHPSLNNLQPHDSGAGAKKMGRHERTREICWNMSAFVEV